MIAKCRQTLVNSRVTEDFIVVDLPPLKRRLATLSAQPMGFTFCTGVDRSTAVLKKQIKVTHTCT